MVASKAFSLIELMVVIAIIGILAAIAVPQYKRYIITSRLEQAADVVQMLANKSITHAAQTGQFMNAFQAGLAATNYGSHGDNYNFDDNLAAATIPYYLTGNYGLSGMGYNADNSGDCGQVSNVLVYLNPQAVGFDNSTATSPNLYLECWLWHYNGVVYEKCSYGYGTNSISQTGDILPGWINENSTSGWDYNNWNNVVGNQTSFINKTCQ